MDKLFLKLLLVAALMALVLAEETAPKATKQKGCEQFKIPFREDDNMSKYVAEMVCAICCVQVKNPRKTWGVNFLTRRCACGHSTRSLLYPSKKLDAEVKPGSIRP